MSDDRNLTGSSATEQIASEQLEPSAEAKKMGRPQAKPLPELDAEMLDAQVAEYGVGAFELSEDDLQILAIKLKYPQASANTIARATGIHSKKVLRTLNKPAFHREHISYFRYTADSMKDASRAAAARLLKLIHSPDDKTALSAIRIAMGPWLAQQKIPTEVKPNISFRVNVTASGNLVREVVEGEIKLMQEAIDGDGSSAKDDIHRVEENE